MNKLWVIAFKDIRGRFTDRTLLVIMLLAPLAISTIIGLAFGGLGRTASPISGIPVAVINNDQPDANGVGFGAMLASLLTEGQLPAGTSASLATCPQSSAQSSASATTGSMSLAELIHGSIFDQTVVQRLVDANEIVAPSVPVGSEEYLNIAARAAIDKGLYTAVVVIPANFSTALMELANPSLQASTATVTVYGNAGRGLSAGIVRSVVDSILAQLTSGNIAIGATLSVLATNQPTALVGASNQDLGKLFVCAFAPGNDLIQLVNIPVQAAPTSTAGSILVTFGSAQALFFALFIGQGGILSMHEERKNWTLQRILISPTPRWTILSGKLIGVVVSVLFQLLILVFALTIVGSLIEGRVAFIWGTDIAKLGLILLAIAVAVSGFGMFLAGIVKGIEQANILGSVLNIALGVLGGAFGFQLPQSISQFSFVYWARSGFETLAAGRGDIATNVLVLFVEGGVLFVIGLLLFNRRFEA